MKILVTGAKGFVGSHLVRHCRTAGHEVVEADMVAACENVGVDVTDAVSVNSMFDAVQPDACAHLAASTFVPDGWNDPRTMFDINLMGTVNMLQACKNIAPSCRMLFASSSLIYDALAAEDESDSAGHTGIANPYSISKLAADMTVRAFARNHGLAVMVARPITHVGPGQSSRFAISSFARQLKMIAKGVSSPILRVGNLDSTRDILDVRDVASAYLLLIEKGRSGESYDIASGKQISLRQALSLLCSLARVEPEIEVDPKLYRPTDSSPQLDAKKIRDEVGWWPQTQLEKTLENIYESTEV